MCRKPLFFKVSLVTLKTVMCPHTHCLRMLFSVSLLSTSCRETPWQALQTCPDAFRILARSPASAKPGASLLLPFYAALILRLAGKVRLPIRGSLQVLQKIFL